MYRIKSVADESGSVIAVLGGSQDDTAGAPVRIGLSVLIGPFGNPEREGRLLRALRRRLEELRGVESRWIGDEF